MIFVTVGASLPFDRLIEYIDTHFAPTTKEEIIAQIHDSSKYTPKNIQYFKTIERDDFLRYLRDSDLVITHAGMGLILDCIKEKKNFILVPRDKSKGEVIDDHQNDICNYLNEAHNFRFIAKNLSDIKLYFKDIEKNKVNTLLEVNEQNLTNLKNNIYNYIKGFTREGRKIFLVGSSGGHFNQILRILPLFPREKVIIITNQTKTNVKGYTLVTIKGDFTDKLLKIRALLFAPYLMVKYRPNIIFTDGGGELALPFSYFGKLFGCKIVFMETISRINSKSKAATYIYPIANKFLVQWKKNLKDYGKKAEYWGSVL